MSEDSEAADAAALDDDDGSPELERQREGFEDFFAIQVVRVDNLILGMHSDLRGVAFSHYFRSFQSLATLVGRAESRRQEEYALRAGFCVWAGVHRSSQRTAYKSWELGRQGFCVWASVLHASQRTAYSSGDLVRRCFCGWSSVCAPQRAKLSAVLILHQELEDRLLATDEELRYLNNRIGPTPPQVDNDAEYHLRCIALAEAAEEELATMESLQCGGCKTLCSQL